MKYAPVLCVLSLLAAAALATESRVPMDAGVHEFIETYCIACHGPDKEKGDRVFHELASREGDAWVIDVSKASTRHLLQDVLDQLNLGEMPPQKKDVRQPDATELQHTRDWLTQTLLGLEAGKRPSQTVLRRLNRREYRNTLENLLGFQNLSIDPTETLPADDKHEGFTNIGEALNLSDAHLDAYLKAADTYLRMAFHFGEAPPSEVIEIKPADWGAPDREARTPWMYRLYTGDKYLDIGAGKKQLSDHFYLATYPQRFKNQGGIQTPGYYQLRLRAEAIRRLTHPYDPAMIPTNLRPPMQLGLYVASGPDGLASDGGKKRRRVGLWDLKDHEPQDFSVTVWLEVGDIPFLNWDNGAGSTDYWMRDILAKYHTDVEFRGKEGSHAWHVVGKDAVPGRLVSDVWKGPMLRVHDVRFVGPMPKTFQSKAQREILNGASNLAEVDLPQALQRFMQRAFRRPVSEAEVAPYLAIEARARSTMKRSAEEAFFLAFKAVLVSPDCLYLKETGDAAGRLNGTELANRLSYFLWSSQPDPLLRRLAEDGKLNQPNTLRMQAERLLKHPRSQSLIDGFTSSWLRFDKLGTMPPDAIKFQEYYRYGLEEAMRNETFAFVENAIRENVPLTDFLDADYTFLNQDLARHYGIEGVEGLPLRRVSLPAGHPRGGLLGQASILTLSANGIDTSPVIRGSWLLENLLGTPPPPPPPDVEALDPDVRGATTIKQRLAKHRDNPACSDCHARIDPLGFPLEYFDPVGGYRDHYAKDRRWQRVKTATRIVPGLPVDGRSELASGEALDTPASLKALLLARKPAFSRALTEKLCTYASGRSMTFRDHDEIARIAEAALEPGRGFRDLIIAVAMSEIVSRR